MCLILKQAITPLCTLMAIPLCKALTIPLTLKLAAIPLITLMCPQASDYTLKSQASGYTHMCPDSQVVVPGSTAEVLERGT